MKTLKIIFTISLLTLFSLSCEKDDPALDDIEGTYYGTLNTVDDVNKAPAISQDAVAVIRKTGDQEIEVHCYTSDFDTIFRLNYFQHEEGFKTCLTGTAFEEIYHMAYARPMGMGMGHNGSEWMNHLSTMHQEEDPHFGEFDPMNQSFEHYFLMEQNNSSSSLHFIGHRIGHRNRN